MLLLPYSGLFSRGVNFPEFPEWTRDSGNLFWTADQRPAADCFKR